MKKKRTKKEISLEGLTQFLNRQAKYNKLHLGKWELILFSHLKQLGYKLKSQQPIICKYKYGYIVDFLLVDYNLIIEADGAQWHSTKAQQKADNQRARRLLKEGYYILRFWNKQISTFSKETIDQIIKQKISLIKLQENE